jgi:hypothetical protein
MWAKERYGERLRGLILQWQGAGTMIGKKEKRKLS